MKAPPRPPNEAQRLAALRRFECLDTPPEEEFDDLAKLAAHICDTPISLISLVDADRQWFKSSVGMSERETPRDISFCGHAILGSGLFSVPDAAADDRFADNPLVLGEPHVRFYAGEPLTSPDGHALGALCVMDRVPRELTASQREALRVLGRQVVAQMDRRRQRAELLQSEQRLFQVFESCPVGLSVTHWPDRRLVDVNAAFTATLGWTRDQALGRTAVELGLIDDDTAARVRALVEPDGRCRDVELAVRTRDGQRRIVLLSAERLELRQEPHVVSTFVDITTRKGAEAELRERDEQLRLYAEHSPAAIAMFDRDMRYLVVSRGWMETYRLGRESVIGRSHYDVFPNLPSRWKEVHERCLAGAIEHRDEDAFLRPDGVTDWIRWEIRPWRQADGSIGGIIIFSEDITERKQREAAVRASEGRYRSLFEYAPDGILVARSDGTYIDANPSLCRMLGYLRADVTQLRMIDTVGADEAARLEAALGSIDARSALRGEWRLRRRDGSTFPADVIATHTPDGNLLVMIHDISQRTATIERLRVAEERMRFALESAVVGIWDMDYRSGALQWSEILESQYGFPRGTFPGTFDAFVERVHPDDRAGLVETITKAMASGSDFRVSHRALRPDGSVRWLSGAGRVQLDDQGRPMRGIGISIDDTERLKLEQQYGQAQKMEAIGRLAGGVAHDFNNLLTAILGYCEVLLNDLALDDTRRQDIMEITKAGMTAASLTRQLLAFSRKQIIEPVLVDLNGTISGIQDMLTRLLGEDLTVVFKLAPDLAQIKADRGQIDQILLNLAVNARDAMPNGGTLTIATANAACGSGGREPTLSVAPASHVMLSVSDTGAGMTAEVKAHLFEPFFTTKEQGKGTGLGLATVHGIVGRMGGTIQVDSAVGKGSSFAIYFPRAEGAATTPQAATGRSSLDHSGQTILVVEDAEGIRRLAKRILEPRGYKVLLAGNAEEALSLFRQNPSIDLVLTDIVMPGASGPELTESLRAERPDLRVVYMSGYTTETVVEQGVLQPGIAFLHKPFTPETLGQKISEVLRQ
jgi:two-component system, cell cycle sensor histidine kinase and response regulator CckA